MGMFIFIMPRKHIHRSPRRFHYGSNFIDHLENANFHSPIRMQNDVATSVDVSTKNKVGKGIFWLQYLMPQK